MATNLRWLVLTGIWLWCCVIHCYQDKSWLPIPVLKNRRDSDSVRSSLEDDVCLDVDVRNSVSYFAKLKNCSVIEGSLQVLLIDNAESKDFENMTFPKLREITGYLLLYRVQGIQSLSNLFPNLAVIRGDTLFHNYALIIYELRAILDVGLSSLTTILRGSVRIEKNPHLCYVDTVDWDLIAKAGRGGHFIKENKAHEQCPNTCPEHGCQMQSSSSKDLRQLKLCWNSNTCQKVCGLDCEYRNLTCSTKYQCCHPECIGGCHGSLADECVACRHVVYKKKCMKQCPPNTYKYLDRRCIEERKCKKIKNKLTITPGTQDIYWKPFKGECLPHCPTGYAENPANKSECVRCRGQCPKICDGAVIDSVSTAQKLKDCTYVNGSLEIQIQGGDNIIKELESSLSSIQEIRGYLKIARSYPLISLNFLKDLVIVHGEQLDKKEYALLVLDNQNLQELWNWEDRKVKLQIRGGKIFFHFNSKLCRNKIEEMKSFVETKPWDDRDVSPSSNGDRVACNVKDMKLEVWQLGHNVAGLRWVNFREIEKNLDFRSLLGYVVYYKQAPEEEGNVTIYDGRDACGADEWKIDDVDAPDGSYVLTLLTHLKPYTRYAAYMRTYTTASAVVGAQTPMVYFTTKTATPTSPLGLKAHASSPTEIIITWLPPKHPNGVIKYYTIDGIRLKDSSEFVSQRNYCNEPVVIANLKKPILDENLATEDPFSSDDKEGVNSKSKNCCPCSKSKKQFPYDEETESQIQFEDFLHNKVYLKNPSFDVNSGSSIHIGKLTTTRAPNSKYLSQSFNATNDFVDDLTTYAENTSQDPTTTTETYDQEGRFFYEVEEMFKAVIDLHHFTEYTIEVKACQEKTGGIQQPPCSAQAITTVRTLPLGKN